MLCVAAGLPERRAAEVLEQVGLASVARRRVKGFSLGMRQRLGLAAALLGEPEVLVLDEPANGLDPEGVHWLRGFLRAYADGGRTVLVSSHLLAEVAQTVDEVVIIAEGRLVTQSSLAALARRATPGVWVRTPQAPALREALAAAGHGVAAESSAADTVVALGTHRRGGRASSPPPPASCSTRCDRRSSTSRSSSSSSPRPREPTGDHASSAPSCSSCAPPASCSSTPCSCWRSCRSAWPSRSRPPACRVRAPRSTAPRGSAQVLSSASSGAVLVLILGILLMAGEYRHSTVTATFLVTPVRSRVVVAKLAAGALVGVLIAVAASAITRGGRAAVARRPRASRSACSAATSASSCWARRPRRRSTRWSASASARLLRNQTAAVVTALVWSTVVESIVVVAAPQVGRWLPGGAVAALSGVTTPGGSLLPLWAGAAVFLAYGLVFAVVGIRLTARRDIT